MTRLRRGWQSDRGAAAVLGAASLMVLMGMAALALDGGLGYDEKRSTQNAADHAALTASFTECSGGSGPASAAAGKASAARNGYDDDGVTNTVTLSSSAFGIWEATVVSNVDTAFGATLGTDDLSVRSVAVADCAVISGLGGYALFASGTACGPFELAFTGANATFEGSIHSNGRLKLNGNTASPTVVTGAVTYVESYSAVGVNDTSGLPKTATQVGILEPPGGWDIDDYKNPLVAGTTAAAAQSAGQYNVVPNGTVFDGVTLANGLYYSPGSFTVKNSTAEKVTLVAAGQIAFIGTNTINVTDNPVTAALPGPWDPTGLGVFSNHINDGTPCNNTAINWSGSAHSWSGVQYAPFGKVDMSGSTNSAFNGAIIAYTISLPGSSSSVIYDNTFTGVVITTLSLTD